jgi:hypothetical protein
VQTTTQIYKYTNTQITNPLNPWQKNLSTNQFVLICAICGKKIQKSNHPTIQKAKKKNAPHKRDVSKTTQPA